MKRAGRPFQFVTASYLTRIENQRAKDAGELREGLETCSDGSIFYHIQKSLREGFGLTVAEALWKQKPVVAAAVGGIPLQAIHKHTGLLAHSIEGTAYQIRFLLAHPSVAEKLGEQGHEHVREHFLITSSVRRYLTLFLHSLNRR